MADTKIPEELKYSEEHEWAKLGDDDVVTVGITDYAQDALGDVTYLELPEVGSEVGQGDACGVVESVKTFSDIYAPVDGEVVAVNEDAADEPEKVNEEPYGDGWLFKIKASDVDQLDDLLDADGYRKHIEESG